MRSSGQDRVAVWGERLRRYERSGLTVTAFCQREGVSVPSFYQWRRRLTETSAGLRVKKSTLRQHRATTPAFQQVLLSSSEAVVAIQLPGGVRVELPAERVPLVRAVVAELMQGKTGRPAGDG